MGGTEVIVENLDKIGIVAVSCVVVVGLTCSIKYLHQQNIKYESSKVTDRKEIKVINKEINELCSRVNTMELLHQQHLLELEELNRNDNDQHS